MVSKKLDVNRLHDLFIKGLSISAIAIEMDAAESEIHYAIKHLRKKDPDKWPRVKIEASSPPILPPIEKVNSDVITRMMTPEEIERLNTLPKQTKDSMGAKIPKINNYFNKQIEMTSEEQRRRANTRYQKIPNEETVEMKTALTKELYLSEKAAGKGNAQIERDYGFKPNYIYKWLKDQELGGVKVAMSIEPNLKKLVKDEIVTKLPLEKPHVDDKLAAILNYVRDLVGPDPRSAIFDLIEAERQRQDKKWGEQNHDPIVWVGILGEEFGEFCQAIIETRFDNGPEERRKGGRDNMRAEAIQVAAVAIAFVEMLDREGGIAQPSDSNM